MSEQKTAYSFRWIVLVVFMLENLTVQILWISFASVTLEAAVYYSVDEFSILLLSMVFMIVYIPISFIASWIIDKYDFKIGASVGALLSGIFGLLRFFAGQDYFLLLLFQIIIGIGQPFLLNAITKLSANWFPKEERTTSTGLSLISQFIGIMLGLLITPFIVLASNIGVMVLIYGILALVIGIVFVVVVKTKPPTPPSGGELEEKVFTFNQMKDIFKNKYFLILTLIFFFGLGMFNMITSYVQLIIVPRGYNATDAGILGALMLIGGIVGCIVMSALSDKYQKRKLLIIVSAAIAMVSLLIMTFAFDLILLDIFGFLLGFGILSAGPVALEFAVEITEPVPEATSNGILMVFGQIGGILFILLFEGFTLPNGDYFPTLLVLTIFGVVILVLAFLLKEE